MLNPDVTELLDDPDLGGGESFTVVRETRRRSLAANQSEQVIRRRFAVTGNVQPAQTEDLQLLPEENRSERVIVIRSKFTFELGTDGKSSYAPADLIIYDGKVWKATRVDHWSAWGFTTTYAVLQRGVVPDGLA